MNTYSIFEQDYNRQRSRDIATVKARTAEEAASISKPDLPSWAKRQKVYVDMGGNAFIQHPDENENHYIFIDRVVD